MMAAMIKPGGPSIIAAFRKFPIAIDPCKRRSTTRGVAER
jgi:hypothetical protein